MFETKLLDPKDYQNVPAAVELFKALTNINESQYDQLNKAALDVKQEIQLFIIVIKKILIVFTGLNMSLHEQLSSLACLSFLLFFIQCRNNTSFFTNALYSDIQMTIQNHFWVTHLFQKHFEDFDTVYQLFLYQLGTDQLELFFSSLRTQTHSRNFSLFELLQRIFLIIQIEKVYERHPEWRQGNRLSVTTNDRASAKSWTGDLTTKNINLPTIWHRGLKSAKDILQSFEFSTQEMNIDDILEKFPRKTVFNWKGNFSNDYLNDENEISNNEIDPVNEDFLGHASDILNDEFYLDSPNSATVSHMGMLYNKSNVINSMINCKTKISNDRFFRVQSLNDSNFELNESIAHCFNNDENICVTDLLTTVLSSKKSFVSLFLIVIDRIRLHGQVKGEISHDMLDNAKIEASVLSLDEAFVDDKYLKWNGKYLSNKSLHIDGNLCSPIKIKYEKNSKIIDGVGFEDKIALIPLENLHEIKEHFQKLLSNVNQKFNIENINYSYPQDLMGHLKLELEKVASLSIDEKFTCPHCKSKPFTCSKKKLRHHIMQHVHIWKDIAQNSKLCGFCGFIGCDIGLVVSSGKGQQKNWSFYSNCAYIVPFSIGCVSSSSSPSSNKPVFCPHCTNKFVLWSDNLQCHYDQQHPTSIAPEINIEEIERLRKFKK